MTIDGIAASLHHLRQKLLAPVDGASLAIFRVAFGGIMLWEVWRYFTYGWIARYYIRPEFHFKYYGFEWLAPWPGAGMYWHFALLGVLATLILVGAVYRLAAGLFFLSFSYVFLLDQARYLNHFYLVLLISLLMCFLPANRLWSVDARMRPRLRCGTIPQWSVWAIILQLEIVLLYAGIVKINPDWLRLQPLAMWLADRGDIPWVGPYLTQTWAAAVGAYGSIALHLVGAPLLLWKRTRFFVFLVYVVFHISNAIAFQIGIFPWITIAATLMFFEPDWPRKLWRYLRSGSPRPRARHDAITAESISVGSSAAVFPASALTRRLMFGFLALFFVFQILVPLRHLAYPGDVAWTEEGHRFSWRMKLRSKDGTAQFHITDPASGRTWQVADVHLQRWQRRAMTCKPDMLLQYAHQLARTWESERGIQDIEIRAEVRCSLNGRRPALLLDPERDLAKVNRTLRRADWILPLPQALVYAGRASP